MNIARRHGLSSCGANGIVVPGPRLRPVQTAAGVTELPLWCSDGARMFDTTRAPTEPIQYSDGFKKAVTAGTVPCTHRTSANEKPSDRTKGLRSSTLHETLLE
jgi:hypothetical protein